MICCSCITNSSNNWRRRCPAGRCGRCAGCSLLRRSAAGDAPVRRQCRPRVSGAHSRPFLATGGDESSGDGNRPASWRCPSIPIKGIVACRAEVATGKPCTPESLFHSSLRRRPWRPGDLLIGRSSLRGRGRIAAREYHRIRRSATDSPGSAATPADATSPGIGR